MGLRDVLGGDADWQKVTRMNGGAPVLPAGTLWGKPTSQMALPTITRWTSWRQIAIWLSSMCHRFSWAVTVKCWRSRSIRPCREPSSAQRKVADAVRQLNAKRVAGMVMTIIDPDKIGRFGQSDAVIYSWRFLRYDTHQ